MTDNPMTKDTFAALVARIESLPVRTEILNVDTSKTGRQSVEMSIELRDSLLATAREIAEALGERERIVGWLNRHAGGELSNNQHVQRAAKSFAKAIERGEHNQGADHD